MARNEEGEFELVVGNRQLLSVLFVLMVLFAVVFTLGYFIGRNTAPEAGMTASAAKPATEASSHPKPEPASPATQAPVEVPPAEGEAAATPTETVPVGGVKPEAPPTEAAQPLAETQPPNPPPAPPAKPARGEVPIPGETYLQVAAVKRPLAEIIVDVLTKKGFSVMAVPVTPGQPDDAPWRALVGPFKDPAAIAKARADLHAAGFKEVIVRKY
jgi:outer membrane biosynthesis protein TonB